MFQIILQDSLIVFHFFHESENHRGKLGTAALSVCKIEDDGNPILKNLWHKIPSDVNTRWWVVVIGSKMYK